MSLERRHVDAEINEQRSLLIELLLVLGDDLGQRLTVKLASQPAGELPILVAHAGVHGQVPCDVVCLNELRLNQLVHHFGRHDVANLLGHEEIRPLGVVLDDVGDTVPMEVERYGVDIIERDFVNLLEVGEDAADPHPLPGDHGLRQSLANVERGGQRDQRDGDGGKLKDHFGSNLCRVVSHVDVRARCEYYIII